jgi:acetyl esterase/lipase
VGTKDPLYPDVVAFQRKLVDAGNDVDFMAIPRAQHAWEREVQHGMPIFDDLRQKAFRKTVDRLRTVYKDDKLRESSA